MKLLGDIKIIVENKEMGMKVKREMHKLIIVSKVLQGLELWGMMMAEAQMVNVFEIKCWSMAGVTRSKRRNTSENECKERHDMQN